MRFPIHPFSTIIILPAYIFHYPMLLTKLRCYPFFIFENLDFCSFQCQGMPRSIIRHFEVSENIKILKKRYNCSALNCTLCNLPCTGAKTLPAERATTTTALLAATDQWTELKCELSRGKMEKSELIYSLSSTSSIEAYKNLKELQKSLKRGKFRRQFVEKDGINHLVSGLSFFNERHKQRQLDVTSRSSSEVNKSVDRSDVVRQILLCLKKLSIGNKNCISQVEKCLIFKF